ncbi:MAG: recombinase family protein [Pseudomonadota bacterium]
MTQKQIRCAIYTRKSSDEGLEQDYNSLDAQRDACRSYIESQKAEGWVVHQGQFDDGGISGGTMDRPSLKRLLTEVERGEIQVIVVYKIDRLTRSLADFARIVEILDKHNASFVSVTQQFNTTTSMGRLTLNVLLSFAQFEREVTSERIRDKIAASKKKGMWMGGRPPLGYDVKNRRLVPNEAEASKVKQIFELALEARSLTRLEKLLATKGIRAKAWRTQEDKPIGGEALSRSGLARMLRNQLYIGKVHHDGKHYRGEQPAIIEKPLWNAVQAMLDAGKQQRASKRNNSFYAPLRGLVFDDRGTRMVASYAKKNNRIAHRYYISAPLVRGGRENVGTVGRINAAWLERKIAVTLSDQPAETVDSKTLERVVERIVRITLYKDEVIVISRDNAGEEKHTRISATLGTPRGAHIIYTQGGKNNQNEALIKAVAQAYSWRKALGSGVYPTIKDLAKQKRLSERYVWKILRLAYLSPSIVEAILDGRQPPGLSLRQINETQLSPDWRMQSEALGFEFKSTIST